jgi:hypothetical protein
MKVGLWGYIKSAFNARPIGMFVAPNWVGLGAVGILGLLNPAVWLFGAAGELAYLLILSTNKRFQRYVDGKHLQDEQEQSTSKLDAMLAQLGPADRRRYEALAARCQAVLQQQGTGDGAVGDLRLQGEGLGRLLWIYLRLLVSRGQFGRLLNETMRPDRDAEPLERRARQLEARLREPSEASDELRKSLEGQLEIVRQRLETQREAREKLAFLDAELARIEEQVELIREQAVVSTDPAAVSARIDQIAATLAGTNQWIRDQQQAYGSVADVLEEPPPLLVPQRGREGE